jgi:hypothetical protein
MDAVTYPAKSVIEFIQKNMIPLRVPFNSKPLADDFNIKWTPTLITLDSRGKEHHRTVGFLPPEELVPSLLLGLGKIHFDQENLAQAIAIFDQVGAQYSKSDAAPEAIYLLCVSKYKSTHQAKPLKEAYERLQASFPASEWTKRAFPYRLL